MCFRSLFRPQKFPPPAPGVRQSSARLRAEALEDRSVPAAYSDPVGDFLPTYTGPHDPGLDVVAHEAVLLEDRVVFFGRMAGPIAPTQESGGLYLIGVDRGQGTARFLRGTPVIGPNVVWDLVVRINPDGTGNVANQVAPGGQPPFGILTPLDPADIRIHGNEFTASVPLSLLLPAATRPPEEWTYNLWPRNGVVVGQNQHVSDLAPDDGNVPVLTVAPARVVGVAVNDGSAQRSMVKSVTLTFDGPVTLDPGAFELARPDGSLVELTVVASEADGRTAAVLTFAGPDLVGGSLADGTYTLTVRAGRVHDRWERALDGDADGAAGGDRAESFHRLFGDADGDGDVDRLDKARFKSAFRSRAGDPAYLWYFDSDGDGDVDGRDKREFNRRFGRP